MNQQEITKNIKDVLITTLGADLGVYNLMNGLVKVKEIPAIQILYPQLGGQPVLEIKAQSGIECIINPDPRVYPQIGMGCAYADLFYEVQIIQHHPTKGLNDALFSAISIFPPIGYNQPIIASAQRLPNNQGFIPAKALFFILLDVKLYGW